MSHPSPYRDKRQDFFRQYFERAKPYEQYLDSGSADYAQKWRDFEKKASLSGSSKEILSRFKRKLNLLVLSGVWCGDCARQGPLLKLIEQAQPAVVCRYLDNRENPELQDELRINGAEKVPVVVVLSEDFFELGRFGDRHLSVYRRKAQSELGTACDPGLFAPEKELEIEAGEWVQFLERFELMLRLAPMLRKRYGD
jgi:glutaredoxin